MKPQPEKVNEIHPTAIVSPGAVLGRYNYVGPYCVIGSNVVIGDSNRFESHVSIGSPPQHADFWSKDFAGVRIGNSCIVREFVTINAGTIKHTTIGDGSVLLIGSHVSHDSVLDELVTLSNNVLLGGHSRIFKGANLGLGSILHQYSVIGHFSMLGMGTIVTKSSRIEPFGVYVGSPARFLKQNDVGIRRHKLTKAEIHLMKAQFKNYFSNAA